MKHRTAGEVKKVGSDWKEKKRGGNDTRCVSSDFQKTHLVCRCMKTICIYIFHLMGWWHDSKRKSCMLKRMPDCFTLSQIQMLYWYFTGKAEQGSVGGKYCSSAGEYLWKCADERDVALNINTQWTAVKDCVLMHVFVCVPQGFQGGLWLLTASAVDV